MAVFLLPGCAQFLKSMQGTMPESKGSPIFRPIERASQTELLDKEQLALLEEDANPTYTIGSGDVVKLDVYGRPEVSGRHVVGPDGQITIPIIGNVLLANATREEARELLQNRTQRYYSAPHVTLSVEEYASNQVTVLGRVERAGMQKFPHPPTLAEVLAGAGAMPIMDKQATLTRCAIMRGRQRMIWVDLKALLNGDPSYNLRMKKGDIIFIPDSADTAVYVLGQIAKPGSYRLTPRMSLLDAIAQAGGLSEDAKPSQIGVYRAGTKQVEVVAFYDLISANRSMNYALEDGDVIFVPRSNIGDFGYYMRQISPGMSVLNFGLSVKALSK